MVELKKIEGQSFKQNGYLVLKNFYDYDREILPVVQAIADIIRDVAAYNKIYLDYEDPMDFLRAGMMQLVSTDRRLGGVVYDAVKQIPEFMALVSSKKNKQILSELYPNLQAGIAAAGYGIRIDFPLENKFKTFWHQEFPAQLRSSRGVVFWTPLLGITRKLGPVEICEGSHQKGYREVFNEHSDGKQGAYSLRLKNEKKLVDSFDKVSPLTSPGDLILMDYFVLHQSGVNECDYPRWSVQFRYFDFNNEFGRKTNWRGSFADGVDFKEVLRGVELQNE